MSNACACYSSLKKWDKVIAKCGDVLAIEKENPKAYFRRAQAYCEIQEFIKAKNDIVNAIKISPKDKSLRILHEKILKSIEDEKNKEKKTVPRCFR